MNLHRNLARTAFLFYLVVFSATLAYSGIGGPYGEYSMAYPGQEFLTLLVHPDGGGNSLDEAKLPYGGIENATITLLLRDANYDPVPNYPREDMWLETEDDGLVTCQGGTIADTNTDQYGMTQWQNPLRGGGHSQALTVVKVNGAEPELTSGVRLNYNSPDINGDLVVNLLDVTLFAEDFFMSPVYSFRSDFYRDGLINIADLAIFSQAIGASCP
jgi:hypothetical protein